MINILSIIGRSKNIFRNDINKYEHSLGKIVSKSSFLVLGGAGSIGQSVVKEIFRLNPKKLHVVDLNENNIVELVRDIRSSYGYIDGDFSTFCIDIGSDIYDAFIKYDGKYDYVLNLSALKHVRSEKDSFTLMRMIDTNIFNTNKTIEHSIKNKAKKYFCVSTDKAANPVNMMGSTKKIMEMFVLNKSSDINISMARFANVAFSDGSLLFGFKNRILKKQPIVAPNDIKRYFMTPEESGQLCLMSCIFGDNGDIFFPKLNEKFNLVSLSEIAIKYIKIKGYEPYMCDDEQEARALAKTLPEKGKWPFLGTISDTTGEKTFEEFFTDSEKIDLDIYESIGIIKADLSHNSLALNEFEKKINFLKSKLKWSKDEIVNEIITLIPGLNYYEKGKYLDDKM
jgi:FlaA1/EpsC-like NDP-sugar epimerase